MTSVNVVHNKAWQIDRIISASRRLLNLTNFLQRRTSYPLAATPMRQVTCILKLYITRSFKSFDLKEFRNTIRWETEY